VSRGGGHRLGVFAAQFFESALRALGEVIGRACDSRAGFWRV
jgi:hypothetical protein